MIWQDIIIDRILSANEIKLGLTSIFSVESDEILIVKSIEDIKEELTDDVRILCQTWMPETEFPFSSEIYLRDHTLLPQENTLKNDIEKIGEFCEVLNCRALIGDDTIIDCSWLLVTSKKDYEQINIDIEKYDCRKEYEVKQ